MKTLPYDEVDDDPGQDQAAHQVPIHPSQLRYTASDIQRSSTKNKFFLLKQYYLKTQCLQKGYEEPNVKNLW